MRPSSVIVYALTGMAVAATIRQRATTGKKTDADGFSTTSFDALRARIHHIDHPARAQFVVADRCRQHKRIDNGGRLRYALL